MPDWKVHLIFGLLFLVLWLNIIHIFSPFLLTFQKLFVLLLLVPFVSIFPDIDVKQSKSRRLIALLVSISAASLYIFLFPRTWYYGPAYFLILYFLIKLFPTKHRGLTHSFKFLLVFSLTATCLLYLAFNFRLSEFLFWLLLLFSTYALHLILDKF